MTTAEYVSRLSALPHDWFVPADLPLVLRKERHLIPALVARGTFERRALDRDDPRRTSGAIYEYRYAG